VDTPFEFTGNEVRVTVSQTGRPGTEKRRPIQGSLRRHPQLTTPALAPLKPESGFHVKEDTVPYRTRKRF
jgi:hypothetical protein